MSRWDNDWLLRRGGRLPPPAATEATAITNATIFHFTDADPAGTAGDYTAQVVLGKAFVNYVTPASAQPTLTGGPRFYNKDRNADPTFMQRSMIRGIELGFDNYVSLGAATLTVNKLPPSTPVPTTSTYGSVVEEINGPPLAAERSAASGTPDAPVISATA